MQMQPPLQNIMDCPRMGITVLRRQSRIRSVQHMTVVLTPIMTTPTTSVDRMVSYYKSNATFPTYYQEHDTEIKASSNPLQTFCQIFYDEAVAEGVDPGVVFA